MGIHVNIGEAKTRLSELVAASLRGEEVILAKAGKPVARITALDDARADEAARLKEERKAKMRAAYGSMKGRFPPTAGDYLLEPAFTEEELDSIYERDW